MIIINNLFKNKLKSTPQKHFLSICALITILFPITGQADAWDNQRSKGLAWLLTEQEQQGYWSDGRKRFVSTAEVLQGIENAGMKPHSSYQRGFSWLANIKAHSVDSLSRQISALGKNKFNTDDLISELNEATKNTGWGWGSYTRSEPGPMDTALALNAYHNSNVSSSAVTQGLCYLNTTNAKGEAFSNGDWTDVTAWGWSYTTVRPRAETRFSNHPAIVPTAYAIFALAERIETGQTFISCSGIIKNDSSKTGSLKFHFDDSILRGVKWLRSLYISGQYKQPSGDSGPRNTALAYLAIKKAQSLGIVGTEVNNELNAARNYLVTNQQTNGSWQSDAFTTGLVLQVLPTANMLDTDGDYIPDSVENILGSNPNDSNSGFVGGIDNSFNLQGYYGLAAQGISFQDDYSIPSVNGQTILPPYSWSRVSGALPPGITLSSGSSPVQAARLAGTPSVGGNYSFVYEVTGANLKKGKMSGWLTVSTASSGNTDDDGDGIPSNWELEHGFNPLSNSDASEDADGDGLSNLTEYQWGLDPRSNDTDNDGIDDKFEVTDNQNYSPNPSLHPLVVSDAALDFDSDDLTNLKEYQLGTDLRNPDTDGDGILDGDEVAAGMNPLLDEELINIVVIIIINSMLLN